MTKLISSKSIVTLSICAAIGSISNLASANETFTNIAPISANKKVEQTRYIVKFKQTNNESVMAHTERSTAANEQLHRQQNDRVLASHGLQSIMHLNKVNAAVTYLTKQQVKALRNDANVEYVEVDQKRYLINTVTRTFDGLNPAVVSPAAQSTPYGITMVQADQVSDANTSNMKVCITDTGYDGNHEDLLPYTDSRITGDDNDGLGNDTGNWWEPGHSHGTHVAGTIAALGNNGIGVTGVNPSGLLPLHIVKIFNNAGNWAYGSDMVKAVEQCQNAGAKVISMSIGGPSSSTTEENAFIAATNAGLLNIAAAGNDGNTSMSYPASYDSVMSVAAIDSSKNLASFSQRNAQVEIAAPGVGVTSTIIGNQYATWDGTSMATPHVSGVAALVWSHFPSCTPAQIRQVMDNTAQDLGSSGRDNSYGYGLVQAKAMYDDIAANGCNGGGTPPPPPPPTETELTNGVPVTGLAAGAGEQLTFTMAVPAGATNISFDMSGGSGDADLYVKFGGTASLNSYDCRPYKYGNSESCAGTSSGGTYSVMINGYSAFSGVTLTGSYTEDNTPPPGGGADYTNDTDVAIKDNRTKTSTIDVTGTGDSGSITVDVDIKHTWVGDLKLTLVAPTGEKAVLREYTGGSADNILESYNINASGIERNGTWKLQVRDNASGDTGYIDSWTIHFN